MVDQGIGQVQGVVHQQMSLLRAPAAYDFEPRRGEQHQPVDPREQGLIGAGQRRIHRAAPAAAGVVGALEIVDRLGEVAFVLCRRADAPAFEDQQVERAIRRLPLFLGQRLITRLVEARQVQHDEQVVVVLVDLRPLTGREHVLEVERVEVVALGQERRLRGRRRLDVQPAQAGVLELSELGLGANDRLPRLRLLAPADCPRDPWQVRHPGSPVEGSHSSI